MKDAEKHLGDVAQKSSVAGLNPALAAEQAAYQALLKLRAREFEVIRGNRRQRQSGRNSGGNQSRRQLQQLELTDEENRYEDQRTARAQQERLSQREQQQRETGQVLNRLRELAQRQNDVNDRVKELQSALEAAKTPQAREEIERQLKRLREQQQQILRDTDELRERMEREENRDRMADARQQVDESREHVRQAGEALEKGRERLRGLPLVDWLLLRRLDLKFLGRRLVGRRWKKHLGRYGRRAANVAGSRRSGTSVT